MATWKRGILTRSPKWGRHLRYWKRVCWKRERGAAQKAARKAASEDRA